MGLTDIGKVTGVLEEDAVITGCVKVPPIIGPGVGLAQTEREGLNRPVIKIDIEFPPLMGLPVA
jgi:hypothetical protein